ncbi:hypothetical protein EUZ85_17035 [Hahella sp. KA22]|uniref:hypothetical protein n=1 Tax=Hahella sp. KA22 TaxID=1628392 RepID=UPI000FDF22B3|nr:hypothetical protein [Hahella sp. KA22]AZZ92339.1 hypothetical protein ENC22_14465 [Hahella sp. KA22]QAY55711.1 hypothetical protein EUZ85_17035 [Hahella sp. KA22]
MANIDEVVIKLKDKEKFCVEYYQPEWILADAVVVELSQFDVSEYNIFDIFSRDVIENYILAPAEPFLSVKEGSVKVESFIKVSGAELKKVDHSSLAPLYQKLIHEWEKAGWITIIKDADSNNSLTICINEK